MRVLNIVKWHFLIWALFLVFEAVIPVHSIYRNRTEVLLLISLYVIASAAVATGLFAVLSPGRDPGSHDHFAWVQPNHIRSIIAVSLTLAWLGNAAILIDKVLIQGIDFSMGPAVARAQWQALAAARPGVSSVYSASGNLLSAMVFIALSVLHLHWETLANAGRRFLLAAGLGALASASYLSGGRTILLMALAGMLSTAIVRAARQRRYVSKHRLRRWQAALAVLASLSYAMYITSERATMSEVSLEDYSARWITSLGGEESDYFYHPTGALAPLAGPYYAGVTTAAYLTHSVWTFEGIIELNSKPGFVMFRHPIELMNKLGIIAVDATPYYFFGFFPTLPGALYYDFGPLGFLLGALVHGFLLGGAMLIVQRGRAGAMGYGYVMAVLSLTYLAPIGFAWDLMAFPFLMLSYGILWMYGWRSWRRLSWYTGTSVNAMANTRGAT